jgi:hypothetical protein
VVNVKFIGQILNKKFSLFLLLSSLLFSKDAETFFKLYIDVENVYPESIHYKVDGKKFKNGDSLKSGKHKVEVWKRGFQPFKKDIYLKKNTSFHLRLKK